jgi:NAD kinase
VKIKHHPSKNAGGYYLVADGQAKMFSETGFDNFQFFADKQGSVHIIHPSGWNFFEILTEKLGWNQM